MENPVLWEWAGNPGRADLQLPPGRLSEDLERAVAPGGPSLRGGVWTQTLRPGAGSAQTRVQSRLVQLVAWGHWRGRGMAGGSGRATEEPRVQTAL